MQYMRDVLHGQSHTHDHGESHDHDHAGLKAEYGLVLPSTIVRLFWIGSAGLVVSLILLNVLETNIIPLVLLGASILLVLPATLLWSVIQWFMLVRKRAIRRVRSWISWRGDEHILDVGTGSGVLLIGLIKQVAEATGTGIDIWQPNAGGGDAHQFMKNIYAEKLQDRITLENVDAREMPFEAESFDVIVSSFAMHHVGGREDRAKAEAEMIRTLKPGGSIALCDIARMMNDSVETLQKAGFEDIRQQGMLFKLILAKKPA